METGIGVVAAVVLVWLGRMGLQRRFIQQHMDQHLGELAEGFFRVQRYALEHVDDGYLKDEYRVEGLGPADIVNYALPAGVFEDHVANHLARTCIGVSVCYTVGREGGNYHHHLSTAAIRRPQRLAVESLLLVMTSLIAELEASGLGEDNRPQFHFTVFGKYPRHLEFDLTPEQHATFCAVVLADQPSAEADAPPS